MYGLLALLIPGMSSTTSKTVRDVRKLPEPGTVLSGKYKLVRVIGEGGMGVVYEGEHIRIGQRVAIKMLLAETPDQTDLVARFEREARASARLKSRHSARVTDVDQTPDGLTYMVMELLHGCDLGVVLDERTKLPVPEALDYVLQACAAIIEAHDLGIVHRDLKPANLFLSNGPDGTVVKLLDFGISKLTDEASKLTSAESIMGTPLYMSPEQIRSARDVDARTDIWSIGILLYELLSGDAPFSGTTTQVAAAIVTDEIPATLVGHGVPPELQAVVLRALTKDRNLRIQTARELAVALLPFVSPSSMGAQAIEATLRQSLGPTSVVAPSSRSGSTLIPTTEKALGPKRATSRVAMGFVIGAAALAAAAVVAFVVMSDPRAPRSAASAITEDAPRASGPAASIVQAAPSIVASAAVLGASSAAPSAEHGMSLAPVTPKSAVSGRAKPGGAAGAHPPRQVPAAVGAGAKTPPQPSAAAPELPNHL